MITENGTRSGMVAFSPRARLLKLIGSELISDEVVAITELVKNAHDADASFVSIQFLDVTGDDGEIIIRDDGHGIDLETLETRWMQPAGSSKNRDGTRYTRLGRRTLGEKGVGRFATDKLASGLELVSRRAGEPTEIRAVFDWNEFDADERMLSDVKSRWDLRTADWIESQGTVLKLTGLRTRWNERLFRRLSTRLSRLVSPFERVPGFRILIESNDFPEYTGEISGGFLDQAPYHVEAEFDGSETITLRLNGGRPLRHAWPGEVRARCGPVHARLFAFDLETEALARVGPRTEVRAWLREWSGVSVYRDGFRVWPYGEPHDDWLRLDQRRVNNPVVRLSNNQVVGFVEISGDRNPELRDQTNREGLIHNEPFADLQRFIVFAMHALEAERQTVRHPGGKRTERGSKPSGTQELTGITDTLERLARQVNGDVGDELRRTADRVRSRITLQETEQRRMLDGYSSLAAIGHTASLLGRSMNMGIAGLRERVTSLRTALGKKAPADPSSLAASVAELDAMLGVVSGQLALVASAGAGATRRRRGLDIPVELCRIRDGLQPVLDQENAEFEVQAPDGVLLRAEMRPEMFASLINVLVRNSLEWRALDRTLRMTALVRESGDALEIVLSDNGKGVLPTLEDKLFEPGVSGHEGAGMGLTIARNIVSAHNGTLSLLRDRRRKGATFIIQLPRKRSRATSSRGS